MAVDTQIKRQSATTVCQPWMLPTVFGETNEVDQEERQAAAWVYCGITAGIAVAAGLIRRGLLLGVYNG